MELQQGVVGPDALLQELVEQVAQAGTVEAAARVCRAARAVGARVVHCTAEHRADGAGITENAKIMALIAKLGREQGLPTEAGSPRRGPGSPNSDLNRPTSPSRACTG